MSESLLQKTLQKKTSNQKPVWIMRQAGRYLPEYRKLRASFPNFLSFCRTPEAAAEATLQPVQRFGLDAAILFSDILVFLPTMGLDLEFVSGKGPCISNPVRTESDVDQLSEPHAESDLEYMSQAIKIVKKELNPNIPLLGFAGGPLTVASYAIEGKSSKDLSKTKAMAFSNPVLFEKLMHKIAQATVDSLCNQSNSGADILVLMDSWAGYFSPQDYRNLIFPHSLNVIKQVKEKTGKPIIHYANGAPTLVDHFCELGADAIGLDWRTPLQETFEKHSDHIFQGNLDPSILFAPEKVIRSETRKILDIIGNRSHIMNLGHGILPETPISSVEIFLSEIRNEN